VYIGDVKSNVISDVAQTIASRDRIRDRALDIFIRSVSSQEAVPVLRQFILDSVINPLSEKVDRPGDPSVALIVAVLTGVAIFRNVLRIRPMLEMEGGELEALIANAIQGLLHGADSAVSSSELEKACR
jgi:hypothetical protein